MGAVAGLTELCRYWTEASQEARYDLFRRAIEGHDNAPPLKFLQVAIYLAECAAGDVSS